MITLATLPEASEQEVFEQIVKHLLKQNARCTFHYSDKEDDEEMTCRYKFEGMSCAAGCLIDDSEYDPAMENNRWSYLAGIAKVPNTHKWLIQKSQEIHDDIPIENWKGSFVHLGKSLNLNTDFI